MPNQPPVTSRSLLYLLKRLKKEKETLVNDTSATFWVWFDKTILHLAQIKNQEASFLGTYKEIAIQNILDRIGKITNKIGRAHV